MASSLTAARVAIVSGKGGVGKTTVAAALATAAARRGKRVLLVEIEDREAFAPLFGVRELTYEERRIDDNLTALSVEPDEALVEYLHLFYGIPKIPRAMAQSKLIEFATNTAPGLRDILLIGKVKEAEQRRRHGRHVYDMIVLDAPPTGRLPRFLDAPRAIVELVRGGPIRSQAQGVLDMVLDPDRVQVVLVTLPEEMPMRETSETSETLAKMGIALGPVVVNGVWREVKGLGRGARARLAEQAENAGLGLDDRALDTLASVGAAHARRARNQRAVIRELAGEVKLPRVELPYLFTDRIGRREVAELAEVLEASPHL